MSLNTSKSVEQIVENHAVQLSFIVGALSEIKDAIKVISATNTDIKVIMERQANHEENNDAEHKHIHKRIDGIEKECEDMKKNHNAKCDLIIPKAHRGETAYKVLAWAGGIGGGAMIVHFMMQVFGIKVG